MEVRARNTSKITGSSSNIQDTSLSARETHMARTVAYLTGVLVLCYSFLMITSFLDMFVENDALFDHLLYPLAETVTFLNSSLNPFLYCWRCRDLKEKIWFVIKGSTYKGKSGSRCNGTLGQRPRAPDTENSTKRQAAAKGFN